MTELPSDNALILVVVMNNLRDLEIARLLGWYRIPIRSAPKVIAVDYLAFYLTSAFGEEKWRINNFAPVQGHELTTRRELFKDEPDHPHASHEYYKIQLGSIRRLPEPILADEWKRITFFYTTGEYFRGARRINDLVIQDDEREMLWKSLRERQMNDEHYLDKIEPEANVDPAILSLLLGYNH